MASDEEQDAEKKGTEWDWTCFHEATHAEVARSLGYKARAKVNRDGSGITEVW